MFELLLPETFFDLPSVNNNLVSIYFLANGVLTLLKTILNLLSVFTLNISFAFVSYANNFCSSDNVLPNDCNDVSNFFKSAIFVIKCFSSSLFLVIFNKKLFTLLLDALIWVCCFLILCNILNLGWLENEITYIYKNSKIFSLICFVELVNLLTNLFLISSIVIESILPRNSRLNVDFNLFKTSLDIFIFSILYLSFIF